MWKPINSRKVTDIISKEKVAEASMLTVNVLKGSENGDCESTKNDYSINCGLNDCDPPSADTTKGNRGKNDGLDDMATILSIHTLC
eukprot:scaffold595710_cov19-Prasinocladus_malaysianus.AAC.1